MRVFGAFALGTVIFCGAAFASTAEFNQRLGACGATTERAKRAVCFEALARDAVGELSKQQVAAAPATASPSKYADFISKAKTNITRDFKDSSSVQWRNTYVSDNKFPVLCGEINAKNSYGAYVGFRKFYATSEPMLQQIADPEDSFVMDKTWPRMCTVITEQVD
ncbi:MAG: hypothetical protein KKG67_20310 [Gammaproteobacteria bacterium]|nr:hypothetical protein [Gammaproteobacteria bacterium]